MYYVYRFTTKTQVPGAVRYNRLYARVCWVVFACRSAHFLDKVRVSEVYRVQVTRTGTREAQERESVCTSGALQ